MPKTIAKKRRSKQKTDKPSEATKITKKKSIKARISIHREQKNFAQQSHKKMTGSFRLFADASSLLRQHWKIFGGIILIYIVLSVALIGVRGSNLEISQAKKDLNNSFVGVGQIGFDLALFGMIVGSSGSSSSQAGGAYQPIVFLIISLATIWALRQLMAGKKIGLRDTLYKGMYPLVPVTIVVFFIGLHLIPVTIGIFLFGVGITGGVAVGFVEMGLWLVLVFLLALLSIYMISSSLFAFYIATLPDMRPRAALKSARKLVRFRRWTIIRKVLFLPLALLVLGAVITMPFIWLLPVAAQWVFLLISMIGLVFAHIYMYNLYRELL